ncbi:MAG: SPASM domain-containing protein [Candidatus Omnitrophota bacterium]
MEKMDELKIFPKDSCRIQNREIRFEVTNMCNAKCVMCPREKMSRPQGILDMGLYTRALDEAYDMGARMVSLENFGETFMDPLFFERAAYAKGKGMEVYTITNGSLFNKKMANLSIYFLDKVRFSVYGATKEVYESIHKGLNFDIVISNIEYLIKEKERLNSKSPRIEVYFLLMENNKGQVEDFKRRWLGLVDDIAIWKPHNWSDGRKYRLAGKDQKKISCGRPVRGPIQIQWDGLVVPCCFDYNSEIVLGDIHKQSLREIITGRAYNEFRNAHAEGNFSSYPFCDSCDQLTKSEDVLIFSTNKGAKVGAVNTTFDKVS